MKSATGILCFICLLTLLILKADYTLQQFTCFGLDPTDLSVCGGNGFCTAQDTCDCQDLSYGGYIHSNINGTLNRLVKIANAPRNEHLVLQLDANLILFSDTAGLPDWASGTYSPLNSDRYMRIDNSTGAFTLHKLDGTVYATVSSGCNGGIGPFRLVVRSDRNLAIYDSIGKICWIIDKYPHIGSVMYHGAKCDVPICFDKNATEVCSGRGYCNVPHNCTCMEGAFGYDCRNFTCFGLAINDTSVCSGHGQCNNLNNCTCNDGYFGSKCQEFNCNGIHYKESSVCSGKGVCSSPNVCNCTQGYSGAYCQEYYCDGTLYNDQNVCSGHGKCNAPDSCSCSAGYSGATCLDYTCYGIHYADQTVCSGRGKCIGPDGCTCPTDFSGTSCQDYYCNGIHYKESNVCNGRGVCSAPTICNCTQGYTGTYCQDFNCNGTYYSDAKVCSGNGKCNAPDSCSCSAGFSGATCQDFYCNGILSNDEKVCSGNGKCASPNNCVCSPQFRGVSCETKVPSTVASLSGNVIGKVNSSISIKKVSTLQMIFILACVMICAILF
ncbi:predicted protein [Naegleria gruberi]|uniref:Predicted protein n=1 Tax=Naegleria gruberi TaxID=5762 RepID=D2VDI6_NAEGR|nr:uncharacterized protein NAEGRDRAFT_48621 [Naegleria gruberi]EFC45148.1 predicted protein [Naegleria gruberi]|eukprot:XP_002677892.1 predicted protein [Naegleria gruberi strain NEG-M]